MTQFFLVLKILITLFFLAMFLRGNRLVWGIGLLTVTTAVLLDTFLNTFGRDEMIDELGFFFFVLAGGLFAGAAVWLWGLLRPVTSDDGRSIPAFRPQGSLAATSSEAANRSASASTLDTAYDRQMLYDEIRHRFGPDDVLDLMFDLDVNENDVIAFNQDLGQLIIAVINLAEAQGQTANLALAVERILTPVPRENLPRLEKLSPDSPRTVLRQFLLAHYSQDQLAQMTADLEIDWEIIAGEGKKARVRNLLLYLIHRSRIDELIDLMQQSLESEEE